MSFVHDGIAFSRLGQHKVDSTLFSAGGLGFPSGELTGPWQTAWVRGVLIALFGDSPASDPDATTFEYELEAIVDGTREVRLVIADAKSEVGGAFGRFGVDVPDPALFARVTDALLDLCETTAPADYESKFYEYATQRYGCSKGAAWVGTKKNGVYSCQPRPGAPFYEHASMRHAFVLDIPDLARDANGESVSDAEVEAYYAKHATPGMPPLASIREHVMRAILAERAPAPSLPFESRAIATSIFDLADKAIYDFVPLAREFTSPYPPEPLDAKRGLRKFRKLRAATSEPELGADLDTCILHLDRAAVAGVPFRIKRRAL